METFKGLFLFFMGLGLMLIALQSLLTGWLPTGRNGDADAARAYRDKSPILYWLFFCIYSGGGGYIMYMASTLPG